MGDLEMAARETTGGHVSAHVDAYLAGRLENEAEVAFEAHLLVCDACFSAYLARTMHTL